MESGGEQKNYLHIQIPILCYYFSDVILWEPSRGRCQWSFTVSQMAQIFQNIRKLFFVVPWRIWAKTLGLKFPTFLQISLREGISHARQEKTSFSLSDRFP